MERQTELLLPAPRVVRCSFARQVQPHLPVMELEWASGIAEETWHFPNRVAIQGPAPRTFGVVIRRHGPDSYSVRLVWNDLGMTWGNLRRLQVLTSALAPVLQSLGTDLRTVLEQPIDGAGHTVWPLAGEKMTA